MGTASSWHRALPLLGPQTCPSKLLPLCRDRQPRAARHWVLLCRGGLLGAGGSSLPAFLS